MKTKLFNIYILCFFLLTDFIVFAQDPGDGGDGDGGLEGDDPAPTPINGKLLWLAILAIVFAYYKYNLRRKEA